MKVNGGSVSGRSADHPGRKPVLRQRFRAEIWHEVQTPAWLRTRAARSALAAALALCLLLGTALALTDRLHSTTAQAFERPADPASDEQTKAQVVESAKQIVTIAGLPTTTAGYLFMSCKDQDGPPYQGAVYLTFAVPSAALTDAYFGEIAARLVTHGWAEGLPPDQRVFGKTLSKDGVTAVISRQLDEPKMGELRIYGQCRNLNNHRDDATAWIDITDQFTAPR